MPALNRSGLYELMASPTWTHSLFYANISAINISRMFTLIKHMFLYLRVWNVRDIRDRRRQFVKHLVCSKFEKKNDIWKICTFDTTIIWLCNVTYNAAIDRSNKFKYIINLSTSLSLSLFLTGRTHTHRTDMKIRYSWRYSLNTTYLNLL